MNKVSKPITQSKAETILNNAKNIKDFNTSSEVRSATEELLFILGGIVVIGWLVYLVMYPLIASIPILVLVTGHLLYRFNKNLWIVSKYIIKGE